MRLSLILPNKTMLKNILTAGSLANAQCAPTEETTMEQFERLGDLGVKQTEINRVGLTSYPRESILG